MAYGQNPPRPMDFGMKNRGLGLRAYAPPSPCRVYKAKPDGTLGKFLRIQPENKDIHRLFKGKVHSLHLVTNGCTIPANRLAGGNNDYEHTRTEWLGKGYKVGVIREN